MVSNLKKIKASSANDEQSQSSSSKKILQNELDERLSKELIIAFCSPIGTKLEPVKNAFMDVLKNANYNVVNIKISDLLMSEVEHDSSFSPEKILNSSPKFKTYRTKQLAGNHLRKKNGQPDFAAQLAIKEIYKKRAELAGHNIESENFSVEASREFAKKKKTAYLIEQLKRPEEIELFKKTYIGRFFLYSVFSELPTRLEYLKEILRTGKSSSNAMAEAQTLIDIDSNESSDNWGQALKKSFLRGDYFHNNTAANIKEIKNSVSRFIKLIHGINGISPTREEFGMYQAYSTSLGSLCLSRQVGACILDLEGNIVAVGRNDVPKFGGGLYETTAENSETQDQRCVHYMGKCFNTALKNEMMEQVQQIIEERISFSEEHIKSILFQEDTNFKEDTAQKITTELNSKIKEIISGPLKDDLSEQSDIKNLIEFSRSVHAEMDAIVSAARKGTRLDKNSSLYTTTYPCHNCARHIVAAGIKEVIYIEPYDKSKAIELHKDSISSLDAKNHMLIRSFYGVAPHRYKDFFMANGDRKIGENAVDTKLASADIRITEHVHSYLAKEAACVSAITNKKNGNIPVIDTE